MICTCTHKDCYFVFYVREARVPARCPDCGHRSVRPATPGEITSFYREHRKRIRSSMHILCH